MIGRGIFHSRHSPLQMRRVGCADGLVVACRSSCEKSAPFAACHSFFAACRSLFAACRPSCRYPGRLLLQFGPHGRGCVLRHLCRARHVPVHASTWEDSCWICEVPGAEGGGRTCRATDHVRRSPQDAPRGPRRPRRPAGERCDAGGPRLPPLRSSRWRCPHYYPSRLSR